MKTIKTILKESPVFSRTISNKLDDICSFIDFPNTFRESKPQIFLSISDSTSKSIEEKYEIDLQDVFAHHLLDNVELQKDFKLLLPETYVNNFPENVRLIVKHYFKGSKLRISDSFLVLKLNSNQCKKFFTMLSFLESGEAWRKYLRTEHNIYYNIYMQAKSFISVLESRTTISDSGVVTSDKENLSLFTRDNDTFVLSIPRLITEDTSDYKEKKDAVNLSNHFMIQLIELSYFINFISGLYDKISESVMEEYQKISQVQEEEKNSAVPAMKSFLSSRIVSKSILNDRKKITKFLQEAFSDIEEIFIPLTNELPFTNSYEELKLKASIYLKDNNEMFHMNKDYKILPPIDLNQEIPGYLSTGIYDLTGFNNQKNQEENDYAPHVMMENYFVSLDEFLFIDALLESEEYSELHEVVSNTMKGIETAALNYLIDKDETFTLDSELARNLLKSTMKNMIIYLNSYFNSEEYPNNQEKNKTIFESMNDYRSHFSKTMNYLEPIEKITKELEDKELESELITEDNTDIIFDYSKINDFIKSYHDSKAMIYNNKKYEAINIENKQEIYMPPIFEIYNFSDISLSLFLDTVSDKYFFISNDNESMKEILESNYLNIPNKPVIEYVLIQNELVATNTRNL